MLSELQSILKEVIDIRNLARDKEPVIYLKASRIITSLSVAIDELKAEERE